MTADREPGGSPVTAVHRSSRGPSAGIVLAGVVAAVVAAVAVALVSGPVPPPTPSPEALVSPSPVPSATTAPVTIQTPSSRVATTVIVLRAADGPAALLATLTGCTSQRGTTDPVAPAVTGDAIDAVAARAGRDTGWLFVPPGIQAATRVWLGDDVVELALAAGVQVVAVSTTGEVWLGGPAGATRWVPIPTPAGRTGWVMTRDEIAGAGACGPWPVPMVVAGQRSVTCSGLGVPACLQQFAKARADVPDIAYPDGDTTMAVAVCRQRNLGCAGRPVVVVSTPAGWPVSTAELRAAMPVPGAGGYELTDESLLPDYVLDVMARPSLPLETAASAPTGAACTATLNGRLQGSPWDPRVAWIDDQRVIWPPNTSAWFVPGAVVEVIGKTDGTTAFAGDQVVLSGTYGQDGRFRACTMRLASVSAGVQPGAGGAPADTPGPSSGPVTGG